jgi:hypothetical protein
MIKRWLPVLLILTLSLQACDYSLSTSTPVTSQAVEVTPSSIPAMTAEATQILSTQAVADTAAPVQPTLATTQPQATPSATPVATQSIVPTQPAMKYRLQPGTPVVLPAFIHTDLGCKWMGVGGQMFALDSTPVTQTVMELGGSLNGQAVSQMSLTGAATDWGPGGYEFTLADQPVESSGTLWLRALDLDGKPVSDKIYFTTYNDCSKNQVMINLVENHPDLGNDIYLPLIHN